MPLSLQRSLLVVALLAGAAPLAAQAHPDFTGTWVMDSSRTLADGGAFASDAETRVLVHRGDSLTQVVSSVYYHDKGTDTTFMRIDGKAWTNGANVSQLRWRGESLGILSSSSNSPGVMFEQSETWTLASDGKTLSIRTEISRNSSHIGTMLLVYRKQEPRSESELR